MNGIEFQQQAPIFPTYKAGVGVAELPVNGFVRCIGERHELGAAAACGWTAVRAATAVLS